MLLQKMFLAKDNEQEKLYMNGTELIPEITEYVYYLTELKKLLLIEASEDSTGTILKVIFMAWFEVQTTIKRLHQDVFPRTEAMWNSIFKNLVNNDLIEEKNYKCEIFSLILLGYKIADLLKEEKWVKRIK